MKKLFTILVFFIVVLIGWPYLLRITVFAWEAKHNIAEEANSYRYGYLNEKAKFIVYPKYKYAARFFNGTAKIHEKVPYNDDIDTSRWAYVAVINTKGVILKKYTANGIDWTRVLDGKRHFNDVPIQTFLREHKFSQGLIATPDFIDKQVLFGFKDGKGNWVIRPQFEYVTDFNKERISFVRKPHLSKWGAIDSKGNWIMLPTCIDMGQFSSGLSLCQVEMRFGKIVTD